MFIKMMNYEDELDLIAAKIRDGEAVFPLEFKDTCIIIEDVLFAEIRKLSDDKFNLFYTLRKEGIDGNDKLVGNYCTEIRGTVYFINDNGKTIHQHKYFPYGFDFNKPHPHFDIKESLKSSGF